MLHVAADVCSSLLSSLPFLPPFPPAPSISSGLPLSTCSGVRLWVSRKHLETTVIVIIQVKVKLNLKKKYYAEHIGMCNFTAVINISTA